MRDSTERRWGRTFRTRFAVFPASSKLYCLYRSNQRALASCEINAQVACRAIATDSSSTALPRRVPPTPDDCLPKFLRAKVQLVSCAEFVSVGVFLGKNA